MVRSRILAELFRNQTARQCGLLIGTQGVGMVLSLAFTLYDEISKLLNYLWPPTKK